MLDIAIYHTQQCAEKSLKAYLSLQECTIDRTHNLDLLVMQCLPFNPRFADIREELLFLMPFATAYRYPEGDLLPSRDKTAEALKMARRVYTFILDVMEQG